MEEVKVQPVDFERLAAILPPGRAERFAEAAVRARAAFGDRVVWHVNATAHGGGVAEMLQTQLAYANGSGIVNRWLVLSGDAHFFAITKRVHNMLHGTVGDGGPLGAAERAHYDEVLRANLDQLLGRVSAGDIVLLHDPQTAGLIEGLRGVGARVIWRCHVGRDESNDVTDAAWAFLRPDVAQAEAVVFSRREYAPDWIDSERLAVIPPPSTRWRRRTCRWSRRTWRQSSSTSVWSPARGGKTSSASSGRTGPREWCVPALRESSWGVVSPLRATCRWWCR
ncbi:hypothetical protein [Nocardioides piscis]|uniref:Trehalose synthase N-terminal domain-containing protein n=1 Tax=Nocardioides piscis TaxID=2714938 RepID=A0A6G7YII8_9ACTN|nr:hypothetical protein [Nocardioides piscis]QIK76537.1 hypothetical protein G7071_15030 [Nocardioides piscis]